MPDDFKVIVTCDPRDEYDFEVGKQIAKKRLMKKYYNALDRRLFMFQDEIWHLSKRSGIEMYR